MSNASSPPQTQSRAGISSHAFLLALATFAIGTDAFIIAGILPQISHDLTVTISSAGLVVSVFSISYAVGAPIVSALFSRIPRKIILVGGLAAFMVANILSAISPTLPILLLTRIIAALAAGLVALPDDLLAHELAFFDPGSDSSSDSAASNATAAATLPPTVH